jgi:hypothetical protein
MLLRELTRPAHTAQAVVLTLRAERRMLVTIITTGRWKV